VSLDVFDYLSQLEQERYRAIVLHSAPEKGASATQFAKKICTRLGGKYLDLLDYFIQSEELCKQIDRFSPEEFRKLLIEKSKGQTILVVDRPDFLLDTWRRAEKKDFFGLIDRNQWDGFKEGMKARLIVCLQTSQEIISMQTSNAQDQRRIFQLSDFNDIL